VIGFKGEREREREREREKEREREAENDRVGVHAMIKCLSSRHD